MKTLAHIRSPGFVFVISAFGSMLLIPAVGWLGLVPFVVGALAVLVWMHALLAGVEKHWVELRAINWNAALPEEKDERERYVDELRKTITATLIDAATKIGGLMRGAAIVAAGGFFATLLVKSSSPELTAKVDANIAPLMLGAALIALFLIAVGVSVLRLRRMTKALGEIFNALGRALSEND